MRARRGSVLGRDAPGARPCSWERSEVGNLNAWVGGKCCACQLLLGVALSSLPPSPFPSSPFLLLPIFLPSSSLPSLPPATPTLGPALLPQSLPSPGTKPARPRLPAGPQSGPKVCLGHCRSPGAHSAAARLIPAHLSGPSGSCSFYGARRQRQCPGVPSPLGRQRRQCALFTLRGRCWVPGSERPPPAHPHPQGLGRGAEGVGCG